MGAAALGAATGLEALPGLGAVIGFLNGAGPARRVGFLCVFILSVTFFRPAVTRGEYLVYSHPWEQHVEEAGIVSILFVTSNSLFQLTSQWISSVGWWSGRVSGIAQWLQLDL